MLTQPDRPFINSRETLLVIDIHNGRQYASETKLFGDTMAKASEAYQGVDAVRFVRFDLETLIGKDVTEDVAEAWVSTNEPDPDDCGTLPDFVRFSEAWESYRDGWQAEHGTRRRSPYSTLNMTQLGLSSPVARI